MKNSILFAVIFVPSFCIFRPSYAKELKINTLLEEVAKKENPERALIAALLSLTHVPDVTFPNETQNFVTMQLINVLLEKIEKAWSADSSKRSDFRRRIDALEVLAAANATANPAYDNVVEDPIKMACFIYLDMDTAGSIHREVISGEFLERYVRGFNPKTPLFMSWAADLILLQLKAYIFAEMCVPIAFSNLLALLGARRNATLRYFDEIVTKLQGEVRKLEDKIYLQQNVSEHVSNFTKRFRIIAYLTNYAISTLMSKFMADTYYWRDWLIACYFGKINSVSQRFEYAFVNSELSVRMLVEDYRNALIVPLNSANFDTFDQKLDECHGKLANSTKCPEEPCGCYDLVREFISCYGSDLIGVLCAMRNLDMKSMVDFSGVWRREVSLWRYTYDVIFIV